MSASPLFFHGRLTGEQARAAPDWPVLTAVLLLHGALLAWMFLADTPSAPAVTPPMTGILVSPASSAGGMPSADNARPGKKAAERPEKRVPHPARKDSAPSETAMPSAPALATGNERDVASSDTPAGGGTSGVAGAAGNSAFFSPRVDAAHLDNPKPAYPLASRKMEEEGTVTLSVHILANGSVAEVRLEKSSGFPRLDEAAMKAVRQWRYVPARQGGAAIAWWHKQAIRFSLAD